MEQNLNALAGAGLKKIFLSQVLQIVGVVCGAIVIGAAALTLGGTLMGSAGAAVGGAGVLAVFGIATIVLTLIGFILNLMGLSKASCAHPEFKTAMMMVLVQIVLSVVGSVVKNSVLTGIIGIATPVVTFLGIYFVCNAAAALLRGIGDEGTAAKGESVRNVYMVCMIVNLVCNVLRSISVLSGLAGIVSGVGSLVQLVAMFVYISFLKRAADVLAAC